MTSFRFCLPLAWLAVMPAMAAPSVPAQPVMERTHSDSSMPENAIAEWRELDAAIQPALEAGRVEEAIAHARAALAWADRNRGSQSALAVLSVDKLRVLLDFAEHYDESETLHLRALGDRKRVLGSDAPETLTELNNLGAWYFARGRLAEAEELLAEALDGRTRLLGTAAADTAVSMNNLAAVMTRQGRLAEAEPLLVRVLSFQADHGGLSSEDSMLALANLAIVYREQRRYTEAAEMLERVRDWREEHLGPDNPATMAVESDLGAVYVDAGLLTEAEPLLDAALSFRREKLGRDDPATLETANNLAGLYRKTGRNAEAEALLRFVLEGRRKSLGETHPLTLAALGNLGATRSAAGKTENAEDLLGAAYAGLAQTLGAAHPDTIEAAANLAILRLSSDRSEALEPARAVVAGLRERRAYSLADRFSEAGNDRERRSFARYFGLLGDAAWLARNETLKAKNRRALDDEAFRSLQEASFERTSRGVARMAALRDIGDAEALRALLDERESLDRLWHELQRGIGETFGRNDPLAKAERKRLTGEIAIRENEIAAIDREIAERFPRYAEFVDPQPLTIDEVQALLRPDEAVILIAPTEFGAHTFAIRPTTYRWHRATRTSASIDSAVRRLRWDAGAEVAANAEEADRWFAEAGEALSFDRSTAWELYRDLLGPVADVIAQPNRVIVSSSGSLTGLPLGVLVTSPPTGADSDPDALRKTEWLADSVVMTQVPSISSIRLLRRFARSGSVESQRLLGIGAPVPMKFEGTGAATMADLPTPGSATDGDAPANSIPQRIGRLSPIPAAAIELQAMRKLLGAERTVLMLGAEATEKALRSSSPSSFSVLAFATHGLMAGDLMKNSEPGLVLTPTGPAPEEDGFLSSPEIAQMELNAEFVILSACDTAAGDTVDPAEGLSGLTRAFFYAGAKNVLVSHWPLLDEAAPRLTVRLLELMKNDPQISGAQALKKAMKEVRDDRSHDANGETWAHPAVWAAFSIIGDDG